MRRFPSLPAKLLLLALPLVGCGSKNELVEPPPPEVQVAPPIRQTIRRSLEFTGTVAPLKEVEIEARVKGFLQEIRFTEGSRQIKANDVLFVIDQQPFKVKVQQAEASVEVAKAKQRSAEAQLASAQAELKNAQVQLVRSRAAGGAVTQSEIDELVAAQGVAEANVRAAEAAQASADAELAAAQASKAEADLELSYTEVISPIDGAITESLVDEGNLVGANETTHLATVVKTDSVYANFYVSESVHLQWKEWQRQGLVKGSAAEMDDLQWPVYLGLADEKGHPHKGYVDYADPGLDASSGTQRVRGVFQNTDEAIPINAFVRIKVPLYPEEAILVDEVAVVRDDAGPYVLVVNDKNMVERRSVELAERYQGMRIILSGLTTDDRLVINGLQRARPGGKVTPVATEMEPPEPPAFETSTAGGNRSEPPATESAAVDPAEPESSVNE